MARLDPERRRMVTSEIIYRLRAMIRDHGFLPGEKLGSERGLAESLGISRSDLRMALASMESSHEVIRKIGRTGGIVVADNRLERNINTIESLPVIARRQGFVLTSKVLGAVIAPASIADIRLLGLDRLDAGALPVGVEHRRSSNPMIYDIMRLRSIEDQPLSLEISHLPASLFPQLLTRDLTEPFYEIFERQYGVVPAKVDETLETVVVDGPMLDGVDVSPLKVPDGTALTRISRVAQDASGRPFALATDLYIAERMRFTMHHSGYVRLSATRR